MFKFLIKFKAHWFLRIIFTIVLAECPFCYFFSIASLLFAVCCAKNSHLLNTNRFAWKICFIYRIEWKFLLISLLLFSMIIICMKHIYEKKKNRKCFKHEKSKWNKNVNNRWMEIRLPKYQKCQSQSERHIKCVFIACSHILQPNMELHFGSDIKFSRFLFLDVIASPLVVLMIKLNSIEKTIGKKHSIYSYFHCKNTLFTGCMSNEYFISSKIFWIDVAVVILFNEIH